MNLIISSSQMKPSPSKQALNHPKDSFNKSSSHSFMSHNHTYPSLSQQVASFAHKTQKREAHYYKEIDQAAALANPIKKQKLEQSPTEMFSYLANSLFSYYANVGSLRKSNTKSDSPSLIASCQVVQTEKPQTIVNSYQKSYNNSIRSPLSSTQASKVMMISPDKPAVKAVQEKSNTTIPIHHQIHTNIHIPAMNHLVIKSPSGSEPSNNFNLCQELGRKKKKSHLQERLEAMFMNSQPNIVNKPNKGIPNATKKTQKVIQKDISLSIQQKQLEERFFQVLGKTQTLLEATQSVIKKVSGGLIKDKSAAKQESSSQEELTFVDKEDALNMTLLDVNDKDPKLQPTDNKMMVEDSVKEKEEKEFFHNDIQYKYESETTIESQKEAEILIIPDTNKISDTIKSISNPIQSGESTSNKTVYTRVGSAYQVEIQNMKLPREKKPLKLIWNPVAPEEGAVEKYMKGLRKVIKGELMSEECALKLFKKFNLDADKTLAVVYRNPRFYQSHLKNKIRCLRSYDPQYWGVENSESCA